MSRESHPVLWGSTYNAAELLPPLAADVQVTPPPPYPTTPNPDVQDTPEAKTARVIAGYLEQSRLIEDQLFSVISSYASAKRSLIVEGVHLTPALMCRLSAACPSCIPFAIHISNVHKHRERFAVRSKYATPFPHCIYVTFCACT
jgi:2-phosphoglycerate kinase